MRFKQEFTLRNSDFNQHDEIKPYIYLSLFQDTASNHTSFLRCGFKEMQESGIAWILMKNEIEIFNEVTLNDKVIVETWASGKSRMDFKRDYEIKKEDGLILARGTSQWIIANYANHKILRTDVIAFPNNIEEPSNCGPIERLNSIDVNDLDLIFEHVIDEDDIDHYGHTNNVRYAALINIVAEKLNKKITKMRINYHNEIKLDQTLAIYYKIEKNSIKGCGLIKENNIRSFDFEVDF